MKLRVLFLYAARNYVTKALAGAPLTILTPFGAEYRRNRLEENLKIESDAPVLDVFKIQGHVGFPGGAVTCGNLPKPGEAGSDVETAQIFQRVSGIVIDRMGPRSDDTHLASEHIPKLRKLVEAGATQPSPETGDARVFLKLKEGAFALVFCAKLFLTRVCVNTHGSEFEATEAVSFITHAIRNVENRPRRIET